MTVKSSLSKKLAAVTLAAGMTFSAGDAFADTASSSQGNDATSTSTAPKPHYEAAFKNAIARAEKLKTVPDSMNVKLVPKTILHNHLGGPITLDYVITLAELKLRQGHPMTYVGVIVPEGSSEVNIEMFSDKNPLNWAKLSEEGKRLYELRKTAFDVVVQNKSEHGAYVDGVLMVEHPQDKMIKTAIGDISPEGAVFIKMGDHPIHIYNSLDQLKTTLNIMFEQDLNITPSAEYERKIRNKDALSAGGSSEGSGEGDSTGSVGRDEPDVSFSMN